MREDVSIVVPVKNNSATLRRVLDSLSDQETERLIEVIIIDDGSCDASVPVIKAHPLFQAGRVRIVPNPRGGLAAAYNAGAQLATHSLLVYMHGDCFIQGHDGLEKLLAPFEDRSVVGTLSQTTMPADLWEQMSFWDRVSNARYIGRASYAFGGKFDGVRKDALSGIGGFDEARFFSAGEDCDVVIRLSRVGRLIKTGACVVHGHQHPPRARFWHILRKQAQLGQAMGALVRKHGFHREYSSALASHIVKGVLFLLACVPGLTWWALGALLVMGALYSGRALFQRDWRIVLVPFANIIQFAVFVGFVVVGAGAGRQRVNYQ